MKAPLGKVLAVGRTGAHFVGAGLGVLGSFLGGVQIGLGMNQIREGKTAEGSVDVTVGDANVGLTVGPAAAVKAKVLAVGGGAGATFLAGLAAFGSLALAGEEPNAQFAGKDDGC
jgi:hypothetical protein